MEFLIKFEDAGEGLVFKKHFTSAFSVAIAYFRGLKSGIWNERGTSMSLGFSEKEGVGVFHFILEAPSLIISIEYSNNEYLVTYKKPQKRPVSFLAKVVDGHSLLRCRKS